MKRDDILSANNDHDFILAKTDLIFPTTLEKLRDIVDTLRELEMPESLTRKYEEAISILEAGKVLWNVHRLIFTGSGWLFEKTLYAYTEKKDAEAMARALNNEPRTDEVYVATDMVW